jgi:CRP-like cAMP-binding protein
MNDVTISKNSVLLRSMPDHAATALYDISVPKSLGTGEVLFREGDPALNVFIVLSGTFKLSRINRQGNEAVVAIQREGDSIATALAFSQNAYPVACTAVEDSRCLAISCEAIRNTLLGSKDTIGAVLAATYAHLHELVDQVAQLKASSALKRVARFLVGLCEVPQGTATFDLPYDKLVIAGVLGMTPETLSRSFARLGEFGITVDGPAVTISEVETVMRFLEAG